VKVRNNLTTICPATALEPWEWILRLVVAALLIVLLSLFVLVLAVLYVWKIVWYWIDTKLGLMSGLERSSSTIGYSTVRWWKRWGLGSITAALLTLWSRCSTWVTSRKGLRH